MWAPTLLLALVTLAAAGPSLQRVELPVIKRADALVIVLDLSASMLAADVQPSRVQRARQKILDLLDTRDEGVTGLVVFAGDAHVVTPLTDDTRTIANLMPALSPAIMPLPGADATSGIELASELLRAAGAQGGQVAVDDRWAAAALTREPPGGRLMTVTRRSRSSPSAPPPAHRYPSPAGLSQGQHRRDCDSHP